MIAVFMPCELLFPLELATARTLLLCSKSQQTRSNAVTQHTTRQTAFTERHVRAARVRFTEITIVPGMADAQRTGAEFKSGLGRGAAAVETAYACTATAAQQRARVMSCPWMLESVASVQSLLLSILSQQRSGSRNGSQQRGVYCCCECMETDLQPGAHSALCALHASAVVASAHVLLLQRSERGKA